MSSSGLIYAVIVGAWAAYLVPMWLRRQDELNEVRPTERFSTAIRLLSGKAAMERRYAKDAERRAGDGSGPNGASPDGRSDGASERSARPGDDEAGESSPDDAEDAVDVRAFADPKTMVGNAGSEAATEIMPPAAGDAADQPEPQERQNARSGGEYEDDLQHERDRQGQHPPHQQREQREQRDRQRKRAQVLARRRRTTMVLFLAFTGGSIVAAVGGFALLWAPAVPAALLTAYIAHLRAQERRRFAVTMDRRHAEAAAQRLRERAERDAGARRMAEADRPTQEHQLPSHANDPRAGRPSERPATQHGQSAASRTPHRASQEPGAADRRALVEQTDHAEWVDQQRGRDRDQSDGEGWDPVPVPLPTYVSAPVAPRSTRGVDLEAPDTWSSARSSAAATEQASRAHQEQDHAARADPAPSAEDAGPTPPGRRSRDRGRTPLFDQYEDYAETDRPRAANE